MINNKENEILEQKLLYRLIRVLYVFALLVGIFMVGVMGWTEKPKEIIDPNKSTIMCENQKYYSFSTVGIFMFTIPVEKTGYNLVGAYDDKRAREFCKANKDYIINNKTVGYNLLRGMNFPEPNLETISYVYNVATKTTGSWGNAISWWFWGGIGVYVGLNILRETLNYIFFGVPFQWSWYKKIN